MSTKPDHADAALPPDDARERILLTAHRLFLAHGLVSVGIDRVTAEAGVAKSTLYRHFRSKDELALAVLERHEQLWTREWLGRALEQDTEIDPTARIFELFDEWFHQATYEGCLFTNAVLETHDRASALRRDGVAKLATIRALLKSSLAGVESADPDKLALELQIVMWGSCVAALNGHTDAAERGRALARLLVERELSA